MSKSPVEKVHTTFGSKAHGPVRVIPPHRVDEFITVPDNIDDLNRNEFWYAGFRAFTPDPGYRLYEIEPPEGMELPMNMVGKFQRNVALELIKGYMEGVAKNGKA